jgi:hypothetical protein
MLSAPNLIEDKGLLNKFIGIYAVIKYNVLASLVLIASY